jgi:hypothetical protein
MRSFPPRLPLTSIAPVESTGLAESYKNRLLAFIDRSAIGASTKSILISQLDHIAARLDATYEKACKGVHADVSSTEARLVVLETYFLLGEVARYAGAVPD